MKLIVVGIGASKSDALEVNGADRSFGLLNQGLSIMELVFHGGQRAHGDLFGRVNDPLLPLSTPYEGMGSAVQLCFISY